MDSNSGSIQSSSGDEEYDSRPDSSCLPSSSFLNHSNSHYGLPLSLNPQSFLSQSLFDPSPNLFHGFPPSNPNLNSSLLNLGSRGAGGGGGSFRFDPADCTDHLPGSSSSTAVTSGPSQSPILGVQGSSAQLLRTIQENGTQSSSSPTDHQTHTGPARNPKKRTRASRRAPTTVLTTDTSNFRAMVQEFTGIPAPPFSGSPYSRSRFDLFGSGMRSSHLEQQMGGSIYPLRPSAQKVQHQQSPFTFSTATPSLLNNNSIIDATNISSTSSSVSIPITATTSTFNHPSSINNYQLSSSDHLNQLSKQPQNMLNMQNQMLSFQSLLQNPPLHPSLTALNPKSQGNLPLSSLDELGISHNPSSNGIQSQNNVTNQGLRLRNINDLNSNNNNNSCKLNFSASSSDHFHHEKGLENVSSRGEGAVDSWICPSE